MAEDIKLNGPSITVIRREDEKMRITASTGISMTDENTGERIELLTGLTPLTLILRGDVLVGEIDLRLLIQEATLHVTKSNAKST